jgi:hypothetical protein
LERDPDFDSVIVIWETRAVDLTNNEKVMLNGGYGGLSFHRGTEQTYCAIHATSVLDRPQRNVFKHKQGHSI